MIKQVFICDVCVVEKPYLMSQERYVMFDSFVIGKLGHVCESCENKIKAKLSRCIVEIKEELRGNK